LKVLSYALNDDLIRDYFDDTDIEFIYYMLRVYEDLYNLECGRINNHN